MDILEKFNKLLNFYSYHQIYCGCEVMDLNYKKSWRTVFSIFCVVLYYACFINVIVNHSDLILELLATSGVATQGACKLYMAIKDHEIIASMVEDYRKFYIDMLPQGLKSRRYQVLNEHVDFCILLYKAYATIIIGALSLIPLYPVVMYCTQGKLVFILSVFVPFVDPLTTYGFVINSVYHIFCTLLCGNGSLAADNGFIMFVIHFAASVNLFSVEIQELNDYLSVADAEMDRIEREKKVQKMLRDIIIAHQKIIEKIQSLDNLFFAAIAVQIFTAVYALAISLFLAATTDYLPAYAFVAMSLFQLILYCGLGTVIEKKSDDLYFNIYDIKWYLLPRAEQKEMVGLLQRSQQSLRFYIAGMIELNVDTCVEILKKIYSFFMLLMNTTA